MRRRDFISLVGGASAWPLTLHAQQAQQRVPTIGYLGTESPSLFARQVRAFNQGLAELGYDENRNVTIEYRWAEGQVDRLGLLAADLVNRRVALIATSTDPAARAAKAATTSVPIVYLSAGDPVARGIIASLARPGGNVTGVTSLNNDLVAKRVELLRELAPQATSAAFLINPNNSEVAERTTKDAQIAAHRLGFDLHVVHASGEPDLDLAFEKVRALQTAGLVVNTQAFFNLRHKRIAALGLRYSVPTVFNYREFAAAGGLMSYGGSNTDGWRLVGVYAGRILRGDRPGDLPFQQVTRVELIINMSTAKALGLAFPMNILGRADEVIE
jgi:putative ABC transport system substrate-binding protein